MNSLYHILAFVLLMVAPLVGFLSYHEYLAALPEVLALASIFAGLGLSIGLVTRVSPQGRWLTSLLYAVASVWFIDVQTDLMDIWNGRQGAYSIVVVLFLIVLSLSYAMGDNFGKVVAGGVSIYLLTAFAFLPTVPSFQDFNNSDFANTEEDYETPPIIHIVLDAHIGIEGIPENIGDGRAIKRDLTHYYVGRGFRLYGRAYSQFGDTNDSLQHVFSLGNEGDQYRYFGAVPGGRWEIHLVREVDFCSGNKFAERCGLSNSSSISWMRPSGLTINEKLKVLFKSHLRTSEVYLKINAILLAIKKRVDPSGAWWPEYNWEHHVRLQPLMATTVSAKMKDALESARAGKNYLFHLILPHAPYILDRKCELKKQTEWVRVIPITGIQTEETRRGAYLAYFDQVECSRRIVDEFLSILKRRKLFDQSVIIIHGDHGPKLNVGTAIPENAEGLRDRFSTLLAIKLPGREGGYEPEPISLATAIRGLADSGMKKLPATESEGRENIVYLNREPTKVDIFELNN